MAALALTIAGLLYPLVLFTTRGTVPPPVFVAAGLALIAGHLTRLDAATSRVWRRPLLLAVALLAAIGLVDAGVAAKCYPVAVSLAAAAAFGWSLVRPPSLIEMFARRQEPDLPLDGQVYCRKVTVVWTLWLIANAAIAAALAVWGTEAAWVLWTGVVAYLVMGALLGGEFLLRRLIRSRGAAP
jgi:uncharacterized membrane protein